MRNHIFANLEKSFTNKHRKQKLFCLHLRHFDGATANTCRHCFSPRLNMRRQFFLSPWLPQCLEGKRDGPGPFCCALTIGAKKKKGKNANLWNSSSVMSSTVNNKRQMRKRSKPQRITKTWYNSVHSKPLYIRGIVCSVLADAVLSYVLPLYSAHSQPSITKRKTTVTTIEQSTMHK
jgi:hypothetical protein